MFRFRHFVRLVVLLLTAPVFATTDLSGTVASTTTLTRAAGPYNLVGDLVIPAGVTVTLEPGVQLIAQGQYGVYVYGTLQGAGTSTTGIVLRGSQPTARGVWQGLYVSASGHLSLQYATIKGGATDVLQMGGTAALTNCSLLLASQDGMSVANAAEVQLAGCRLSSNGRRGLTIEGYQATGRIATCEFRANAGYPVRLKATLVELLKAGNRYYGNGTQRVAVSCSLSDDITDDDVWTRQTVPFELGAEETGQTLNIAAGARLVIATGTTLLGDRIECRGRLNINGLAATPCVLKPRTASPQPGDWHGLTFFPGAIGVIHGTTISAADTGITADGAALTVTDSTVLNSSYDGARLTGNTALTLVRNTFTGSGRNGLRLEGPALSGRVAACSFRGNHSYPLWTLARNLTLVSSGNSYSGDSLERVAVSCGGNPDLGTGLHAWLAQGLPLDLTVNATGTTLNIGAGAVLNIRAGQTLYLGGVVVKGTLNASGTAGSPISFLPPLGTSSWAGLQWNGGSGSLTSVKVTGATTACNLLNASPTISDCSFTSSQYDGLACAGTAAPVITGTRLTGNGRHGVYVSGTALPNLGDLSNASTQDDGGNTLAGNGGYDLYNNTAGTLRAQNNTWASTDNATIRARIFDQADQASLGTVIYSPISGAAAPVRAAGTPVAAVALSAAVAGGGNVAFCWTATTPSCVDLRILNLAGRTVATVASDRPVPAGSAQVLWQPRSSAGTRMPHGTYLAVLEARGQGGMRQRLLAPFVLP